VDILGEGERIVAKLQTLSLWKSFVYLCMATVW